MKLNYETSMEHLVHVVQEISLTRSLEPLMAIVRRAARELTGADGASFVLRDGNMCHYADEDAISPLWKGQRFPMEACISGWVMLHHQATFIEDIYQDPRIPIDAYRPTFVKSLAMVPIRTQNPIGAIGNYWASQHKVTAEEIKLLQALADTVSVAMENIQLYQRLEHSHHLFSTFMDNAPFGAAVKDNQGRFLFTNPRMAQMFGKKPEDMFGHAATDFATTAASIASQSWAEDLKVLQAKQITTQTYVNTHPSGTERHHLVTKFPITGEYGEPQLGIAAIDITDRVQAERTRELAHIKLQQSYKMAALGEMAGGIAHEINNPLSIIIGKSRQLCEVLDAEPLETDLAKDFAAAIIEMSERIISIINGLTTISRHAERDPCVSVKLGSIIDGTIAIAAAKFRHGGVTLKVDNRIKDLSIECRPTEISQVLINLLGNAFDAVAGLDEKWVSLSTHVEGHKWLSLAVTDSGRGIPKNLQHKIMLPFFTTKDFGKGTGLGLSISKGIVESHGGSFTIDTDCPNTRFLIRLPIRQNQIGISA